MYVSMDGFLKELKDLATQGFPGSKVEAYLQDTLIDPDSLKPYLYFQRDSYTRNLVHKEKAFELLVLCWDAGQRAPIHGHEGELCWARVERGALLFTNYREVSARPLKLEKTGAPVVGQVSYLDGPADIHEVENSSGEAAVTLHVYSHPYEECDIYDLAKGEKRRVRLKYDTMFGQAVSPAA